MTYDEDFTTDAYAKARRWQILWPQVIALAWKNHDNFKQRLIDDPIGTLKDTFGYELSKELLKLTIVDLANPQYKRQEPPQDINPRFDTAAYLTAADNKDVKIPFKNIWKDLPPMELTLYLPPAPQRVQDYAIAVTAYSDTGRTYPMTSG